MKSPESRGRLLADPRAGAAGGGAAGGRKKYGIPRARQNPGAGRRAGGGGPRARGGRKKRRARKKNIGENRAKFYLIKSLKIPYDKGLKIPGPMP